jgi:tungstate transport system substrate-binding protein
MRFIMLRRAFIPLFVALTLLSVACQSAPATTTPPADRGAAPTAAPAAPTAAPAAPTAAPVAPTVASAAPTAAPAAASNPFLLMSSTIGPIDAGIVGALEEAYSKKTGIKIRHVGAGTGATLDMAKNGQFDLVLVHARALEDKFIADGFGVDRRDLMYNDFVILGPASDPAKIRGEKDATVALKKIADAKALCVTRGDNSGTDVKEKELWAKAGIKPAGDWYVVYEKGSTGNGPTTKYADQRQAYVLMDRATIITLGNEIKLETLVERGEDLLNYISLIKVNPAKFPKVNAAGANQYVDWLVSDEAQQLIKDFGVAQYGKPLFFPNSEQWRKSHPAN